jgi:uncharacterized protein YndB with AHSA1/START domain
MVKKILLTTVIVVVVVVAAILVIAATRPDTFKVERSASIKAPPDKVFALINDFPSWQAWSPWEGLDPNMKRTMSATTAGKGAVYEWDGNNEVGKGRMEIVESTPPSKVGIQLAFFRPFEAHNTAEFTLVPEGDATRVTWTMNGPMPYISKVISLFCDMDKLIGKDFEAGLAKMKSVAEK